jgi:hypothetical protein
MFGCYCAIMEPQDRNINLGFHITKRYRLLVTRFQGYLTTPITSPCMSHTSFRFWYLDSQHNVPIYKLALDETPWYWLALIC